MRGVLVHARYRGCAVAIVLAHRNMAQLDVLLVHRHRERRLTLVSTVSQTSQRLQETLDRGVNNYAPFVVGRREMN